MTDYYVTYTLKDKKTRDEFYAEVKNRGIIDASKAEAGCYRYEYYYPADFENKIFLWEQWENRSVQAEHTKTPHFAVLSELKELYGVEAEIVVEDRIAK